MAANKSSISKVDNLEKMGEFWDKYDFTEFDDVNAPDIEFKVTVAVPIDLDLFSALEEQAHLRGVSVQTLVNLWLQRMMAEKKVG